MCAKMGPRGCEELSFCMNRYMESIVKYLGKYGGDIIKFVGDAMIVVWPRDEGNPDNDLTSVSRKAIKVPIFLNFHYLFHYKTHPFVHSAQWIFKQN
jgi:class 3 adenylate cyclase